MTTGRVHTVLETHAQHALQAQDATNQRVENILKVFQGQMTHLQTKVGQLETELAAEKSQRVREVSVLQLQVKELERQLGLKTGSIADQLKLIQESVTPLEEQLKHLSYAFHAHYHNHGSAYQSGPRTSQAIGW
jgi:CII-binding regulator of phage lambda lysogenization HflD